MPKQVDEFAKKMEDVSWNVDSKKLEKFIEKILNRMKGSLDAAERPGTPVRNTNRVRRRLTSNFVPQAHADFNNRLSAQRNKASPGYEPGTHSVFIRDKKEEPIFNPAPHIVAPLTKKADEITLKPNPNIVAPLTKTSGEPTPKKTEAPKNTEPTEAEKREAAARVAEEKKTIENIKKQLSANTLFDARLALDSIAHLRKTCDVPGYDKAKLESALQPLEKNAKDAIKLGTDLQKSVREEVPRLRNRSQELDQEQKDNWTKYKNRGFGTKAIGIFDGDNKTYKDLSLALIQKSSMMSRVADAGDGVKESTAKFSAQMDFLKNAKTVMGEDATLTDFKNRVAGITPSLTPLEFLDKRVWQPTKNVAGELGKTDTSGAYS